MRVCNVCGGAKPLSEFGSAKGPNSHSFNANVTPALKFDCKPCLAQKAREWRAKNKGYDGTGRFSQHRGTDRKIVSAICTRIMQSKGNNKRLKRPHNITMEYMYELWKQQKGRCKYTNQELFIEKKHPATLSIDKIKPELGYVEGNVQWVAWAVNRAKGDLDEETFLRMCSAVTKGATTIPSGSTPK